MSFHPDDKNSHLHTKSQSCGSQYKVADARANRDKSGYSPLVYVPTTQQIHEYQTDAQYKEARLLCEKVYIPTKQAELFLCGSIQIENKHPSTEQRSCNHHKNPKEAFTKNLTTLFNHYGNTIKCGTELSNISSSLHLPFRTCPYFNPDEYLSPIDGQDLYSCQTPCSPSQIVMYIYIACICSIFYNNT